MLLMTSGTSKASLGYKVLALTFQARSVQEKSGKIPGSPISFHQETATRLKVVEFQRFGRYKHDWILDAIMTVNLQDLIALETVLVDLVKPAC